VFGNSYIRQVLFWSSLPLETNFVGRFSAKCHLGEKEQIGQMTSLFFSPYTHTCNLLFPLEVEKEEQNSFLRWMSMDELSPLHGAAECPNEESPH
jgi:hypothetical protein